MSDVMEVAMEVMTALRRLKRPEDRSRVMDAVSLLFDGECEGLEPIRFPDTSPTVTLPADSSLERSTKAMQRAILKVLQDKDDGDGLAPRTLAGMIGAEPHMTAFKSAIVGLLRDKLVNATGKTQDRRYFLAKDEPAA